MYRIAIVVSTVGFHWEELFAAYWTYADAGMEISLYTVNGQKPKADPMSLKPTGPASLMGLGMPTSIAPSTPRGEALMAKLQDASHLKEMDPSKFDALYLPGGHGCLFDVNRNPLLHSAIKTMYDQGKFLAAVCHATSTFGFVKKNGRSIIEGHSITGFPHALDSILIKAGLVRPEFLPLPLINDHELKNAGAQHSALDETLAFVNPRHWTLSLPFITGMGPKSAAPVAKALIKALKERSDVAEPASKASTSRRA